MRERRDIDGLVVRLLLFRLRLGGEGGGIITLPLSLSGVPSTSILSSPHFPPSHFPL